jgi:hypothetical protein
VLFLVISTCTFHAAVQSIYSEEGDCSYVRAARLLVCENSEIARV